MSAFFMIACSIASYTGYALFFSRAAGRIDPFLSAGIVNTIGAVFPLAVYFFMKSRDSSLSVPMPGGIVFSALAGLCIAMFGIFLMKSFEAGASSYVIPMVYGGTIMLSTLAAWLVFRESIPPIQAVGTGLVLCGLGVIVFSKMTPH